MAATTGFADFEDYPHCISHCPPLLNDCMELLMGNKSSTTSSLGLQLLLVKGNCFNQQFAELSRELLWLRWFDFQYKKLPNWLSLRKLHVLELYNAGALEDLWMPDTEAPFPELRELIITSSQHEFILQSFPTSIGSLGHFKKLALLGGFNSGEFKIRGLPEEFANLQSLEHLELRHCTILASLPICFGDLTNLRHLDLSFCKQLTTLPVSFGQLTQLQYLDLSVCLNLTFNNDILDNITKIEILKFTFCHKLHELPHQLTSQANLRELFLDGIRIRELPADIDKLSKLEVLKIGSPFLENLPMSLGNLSCLTRLTIDHCPELKYLPESLGDLNHLEYLKLGWSGVEDLPEGVGQLSNLQTLELINTPIRDLPLANCKVLYKNRRMLNKVDPPICKLARLLQLRKMTLWAPGVTEISISKECCPSLETLEIVENKSLEKIITLPVTVKIMRLNACNMLKNIKGIASLINLEKLMICHCPELDGLPSLENLISLKELEIEVSSQVSIIEGFEHLRSLRMLTLTTSWNQPGIRSLEGIDRLKKLQLVANTRSALETCIGTIQRWPCEMTIAGRAVRDVDSIVSPFAFPNLNAVDKLTLVDDASMVRKGWWMLQFPETCLQNAAAIIVFFVVHCHQDTSLLVSVHGVFDQLSGSSRSSMRLRQGKWLYIGVFADGSLLMEDLKNSFADAIVVDHQPEKYKIEKGMAVILSKGKEWKAVHTFYQILALMEHCD